MKDAILQFIAVIFIVLLAILLVAGAAVVGGFVLQQIWWWFITPLGLPGINLPHAIGITFVMRFLTSQDTSEIKRLLTKDRGEISDQEKLKDTVWSLKHFLYRGYFWPVVVLGMAWLVLQFM